MVQVRNVLDLGMSFLGQPYKWGGSSPETGFDCSGLLQWIFAKNGIQLPRVSRDQARAGTAVSIRNAQPGDLIAFDNSPDRPGVDHIGVYLGNGRMLQAPRTGRNIEVVNVDLRRATTIRRVVPNDPMTYAGMNNTNGGYIYGGGTGTGALLGGAIGGAAQGIPGGGTDPGSITYRTGGSDPAVVPIDRDEAIASYGYIAQLASAVPDIKRTLDRALAEGWTAMRFTAEIQKTAWWRKTSETQRQGVVLKTTNPGEYRRQLQQKRAAITILGRQLGATLDTKRLDMLSEQALMQGWTTQEMTRYVVADVKFSGGYGKGQANVVLGELREKAAEYLVQPSANTLMSWTKRILIGDTDINAFEEGIKKQAKALFPTLASALDRGVTVAQYVEPYRQLAAQTLEMAPDAIDFRQAKFRDPLFQVDPKTGQRTTMSLSAYQTYLRGLPQWGNTRQAQEQGAELGESMLRMFGKVA